MTDVLAAIPAGKKKFFIRGKSKTAKDDRQPPPPKKDSGSTTGGQLHQLSVCWKHAKFGEKAHQCALSASCQWSGN